MVLSSHTVTGTVGYNALIRGRLCGCVMAQDNSCTDTKELWDATQAATGGGYQCNCADEAVTVILIITIPVLLPQPQHFLHVAHLYPSLLLLWSDFRTREAAMPRTSVSGPTNFCLAFSFFYPGFSCESVNMIPLS